MQKVIYMNQIQDYSDSIDQAVIDYISDGQIETYESFKNFDIVAFDWCDLQNPDAQLSQILIYIDKDDLFFMCENEASFNATERFFVEDRSNEHAMFVFLKNLFKGSVKHLEQLEKCVSALDDDVADGTEDGLREKITHSRNEVLRVNNYYEQLVFLFEEICENDNGLISDDCLKYFEVLRNRAVRLLSRSSSLRDYIAQVRESYQSQIGIEQNNLMKVFTIITSIFLPLTLIVGWYGMNLKMPEFGWKYGYLFVAGLCVAVCAVWFIVFKKNKLFK